MPSPEIALSVTTYQKPWHLRRALESIRGQRGVDAKMEVVVTDDGSTDETADIVASFRRGASFDVHFTTHPRAAFQVGRCRNEGARATSAPYLLYLDGDCVLPPDHVALHLARRLPGRALIGDCYRIEQEISDTLTEEGARQGEFLAWRVIGERQRLARQHRKTILYNLLRRRRKPKLVGNNFSIWRSDFERVNGFDENYRGWGQEDDDLGIRLKRAGVKLQSILGETRLYHLWHPRDPTATDEWREGPNINYFLRQGALIRCRNGLRKRTVADLNVRQVGQPRDPRCVTRLWEESGHAPRSSGPDHGHSACEVEILFLPGDGRFSGRAQCNVLVALEGANPTPAQLRSAHTIIGDRSASWEASTLVRRFRLSEFAQALDAVA